MKRELLLGFLLCCYLGVHNGHLALWSDDAADPLLVLPYRVELYPPSDQQALQQGIPYESDAELSALLEDFMS